MQHEHGHGNTIIAQGKAASEGFSSAGHLQIEHTQKLQQVRLGAHRDPKQALEASAHIRVADELHRQRCAGLNPAYYPASLAHHHAVQQGRMRVLECDWPKGYKDKDGICLAELL